MPGRLGPRFALEAVFLILLAVGAGLADLTTREIALVMALGWLLVALFELATERLYATAPPFRRAYPVAPPVAAPARDPLPASEPTEVVRLGEVEEATVIAQAVSPVAAASDPPPPGPAIADDVVPESELDAEPEVMPPPPALIADAHEVDPADAEPEPAPRHRLEPLQPRPKRRWFGRGERSSSDPPEGEREPEVSSQPKHVRLLPGRRESSRVTDEVAEIFDEVAESDERR